MDQLINDASNVLQKIFLMAMLFGALIRLTDGRREHIAERIALFLVSSGAFFQLMKTAHPSGTALPVLLTNAGVALWMLIEVYKYYVKSYEKL